jgi:Fur family transcriptional regulator, ferric uptake regulator
VDTKHRRNTRQRQAILEDLRARKTHPTASEIFHSVRDRLPRISLGTVYRNLEVLAENGQVMRMSGAGPEIRFDGNPLPHSHVFCASCERLADLDLEVPVLDRMQGSVVGGFLITSHNLTLHGVCASCRMKP